VYGYAGGLRLWDILARPASPAIIHRDWPSPLVLYEGDYIQVYEQPASGVLDAHVWGSYVDVDFNA